jgi:hypothetical protein
MSARNIDALYERKKNRARGDDSVRVEKAGVILKCFSVADYEAPCPYDPVLRNCLGFMLYLLGRKFFSILS